MVVLNPAGFPDLVGATPLEYLERLNWQNSVFGDTICLEGIAQETGGTVVITSQSQIKGEEVSVEEFMGFMSKLWFKPLKGLHLGRPGSVGFYRDLDEVAAFDAHPGNFVKDTEGIVLPIDLILLSADEALQRALGPFLDA